MAHRKNVVLSDTTTCQPINVRFGLRTNKRTEKKSNKSIKRSIFCVCALVSRLCVARVGIHDFAPCRCRNFNSPEQRAIFQFDFSICLVCRIAETNNWKVHMEHERIQRETERERETPNEAGVCISGLATERRN